MNRRLAIALSLLLAAIASGCATVGLRGGGPSHTEPVTESRLENGLTLLVEERRDAPVTALALWLRIGSCQDSDSLAGVAHFIEHMFFKGTESLPVGEIDKRIESLGGNWNGATSYDFTEFHVVVGEEHIEPVMAILGEVAQHSSFAPIEVEHERLVIMEEIRMNIDDPREQVWDLFMSAAFTRHPYRRPILGTMETVRGMTRDDLHRCYCCAYTPANLTVVAVGDVDAEAVHALAERYFGSREWAAKKEPPTGREEPPLEETRRVRITRQLDRAYLLLGFRSPRAGDRESVPMDVLAAVLGVGRSSRLVRTLKEERQLVSEIRAYNYSMREGGVFLVEAECDGGAVGQVEQAILEVIGEAVWLGVSEEELSRARAVLRARNIFERETVEGEADFLGYSAVTSGLRAGLSYLDRIDRISIRDIDRVAGRYLKKGHALAVVSPQTAPVGQER
jgi:zinc protease